MGGFVLPRHSGLVDGDDGDDYAVLGDDGTVAIKPVVHSEVPRAGAAQTVEHTTATNRHLDVCCSKQKGQEVLTNTSLIHSLFRVFCDLKSHVRGPFSEI
jgi:hypothetical protein